MALKKLVARGCLALAILAPWPLAADEVGPARHLITLGDYTAAYAILESEAQKGSPEAALQIGLMWDRGLGRKADPATAFKWYQRAAEAGLATAQLNVAVMLDSGIGTARDPADALLWYSRAALRGNARAQYNLGLLYENGLGTSRNSDLGAYWFGQAAEALPAASEKYEVVAFRNVNVTLSAPEPMFEKVTKDAIEIVWRAAPGPAGSLFLVEVLPVAPGNEGSDALLIQTRASGLIIPRDSSDNPVIWRVSRVDPATGRYEASGWQNLPDRFSAPTGHIEILTKRPTPFASLLESDLRHAGLRVALPAFDIKENSTLDRTRVSYGFEQDAVLAGRVAELLPSISSEDIIFERGEGSKPGLVRIWLAEGSK